jgi:hypothetical protein
LLTAGEEELEVNYKNFILYSLIANIVFSPLCIFENSNIVALSGIKKKVNVNPYLLSLSDSFL